MDFKAVSANFTLIKPVSILIVVISHYFGGYWWIPAAMGLFVFGFSSGYFTGKKYNDNFSLLYFWKSKFFRLIPRIFIANLFLFFLFLFEGKSGIFSWHTIIHILGLSGLLNWMFITNISPFGMGLWFLTTLLIFYSIYPLVRLWLRKKNHGFFFLLIALIALSYGHFSVKFGYQLWSTSFSFLFGVFWSIQNRKVNLSYLIIVSILVILAALLIKIFFHYSFVNYFALLILSGSLCLYFTSVAFPSYLIRLYSWLNNCIFEIYLIHPYLFLKSDNYPVVVNFCISMMLIVVVAYLLSYLRTRLTAYLITQKVDISPS